MVFEVGHTLVVSKEIEVAAAYGTTIIGHDGRTYYQGEWNMEFTTPKKWPAIPGDMWKSRGLKYAAMKRNGKVILEPMDDEDMPTVYPEEYDRFLKTNPVLISRG